MHTNSTENWQGNIGTTMQVLIVNQWAYESNAKLILAIDFG